MGILAPQGSADLRRAGLVKLPGQFILPSGYPCPRPQFNSIAVIELARAGLMAAENPGGGRVCCRCYDAMPSVGASFCCRRGRHGISPLRAIPLTLSAAIARPAPGSREWLARSAQINYASGDSCGLGIETFIGSSGRYSIPTEGPHRYCAPGCRAPARTGRQPA